MGQERKEKEEDGGRRKAYNRYFENRERVVNMGNRPEDTELDSFALEEKNRGPGTEE